MRISDWSSDVCSSDLPGNDRGGIAGDADHNGFDPSRKGFFHGGDLKGLRERLDYLQGMGITAIWVTPISQNKAVQGATAQRSAGYQGRSAERSGGKECVSTCILGWCPYTPKNKKLLNINI